MLHGPKRSPVNAIILLCVLPFVAGVTLGSPRAQAYDRIKNIKIYRYGNPRILVATGKKGILSKAPHDPSQIVIVAANSTEAEKLNAIARYINFKITYQRKGYTRTETEDFMRAGPPGTKSGPWPFVQVNW